MYQTGIHLLIETWNFARNVRNWLVQTSIWAEMFQALFLYQYEKYQPVRFAVDHFGCRAFCGCGEAMGW